jgi:hypothetical protein
MHAEENKSIDLNSLPNGAVQLEMDPNMFKYPRASAEILQKMREDPELYHPEHLSTDRSKFFRECTKDDEMSNHKFNSIKDLYNSLDGKFDQIADADPNYKEDTIITYMRDHNRIRGLPIGKVFLSENEDERLDVLMEIMKATWVIDYNNDKREYTQGDAWPMIAFQNYTDYNKYETFFLIMKLLHQRTFKYIIPTSRSSPRIHNSDKNWNSNNLSIWWPMLQTLANERPVFFQSMRKLKKMDNFYIGTRFTIEVFAFAPIKLTGAMQPHMVKLFYKNFLIKGFKGIYIFFSTIFFKTIKKDTHMFDTPDTATMTHVELKPKKINFIIPDDIFFKNYNQDDADMIYHQTLKSPLLETETTQEELNETEQKYFTEKKLNKLSKIYNKTKFKHDGKTFAQIKVKRTNKFSSMFGGKKKYTKRSWVKIKKHKTKRK